MEKLKLFRLIHKDPHIRVGAVVIGRQAEVVFPKPHQRYYVMVDGIKYIDFSGASFICELTEDQEKECLEKVKEDVLKFEKI